MYFSALWGVGTSCRFFKFSWRRNRARRFVAVIVFHLHAKGGSDAGKAVDHDADQGPVA